MEEAFDLYGDYEAEVLDNVEMINGSGSEDELARRLVRATPSLKEVQSGISDRIDKKNYSVDVDSDRGAAFTYWGKSQGNAKFQL